jgi:hypothetical protein
MQAFYLNFLKFVASFDIVPISPGDIDPYLIRDKT